MPELPEVEAARRAVEAHCLGKKIVRSIIADDSKVIDGVSPGDFQASLLGKTIVAAHRKGKNMWLELDSPPYPSFQFGMTGAVYIKGVAVTQYKRSAVKDNDEWPSQYSKFFLELSDGLELSFTDKRRFAKVRLLENPRMVPPISELGPDALLEPMTVDAFYGLSIKKKIGIKAFLLDQGFISGIGNWVADEVLYQARIHPLQSASSMSKEMCGRLINSINEVIGKAVEVGADSSQFPINWIFHSREKRPGKAFVDGKKIEFITAGGRTTAYVPEIQKLGGVQATKEAGKPEKVLAKRATSVKGKPKGSLNVGDDGNEEDSDNGYGDENPKKPASKKPPARSKRKKSSTEDNEGESKRTGKTKHASSKRKTLESGDSGGENVDDENGGKQKKVKGKKEKKAPKKIVDDEENNGHGDSDEDLKKAATPSEKPSVRSKPKKITKKDNEGEAKQTGKSKDASRKRKTLEGGDAAGDNVDNENRGKQKNAKGTKEKEASRKSVS